jgi:hypothetical protein
MTMAVGRKTNDDEERIKISVPRIDSNPRTQQRGRLISCATNDISIQIACFIINFNRMSIYDGLIFKFQIISLKIKQTAAAQRPKEKVVSV